LRGGLLTRHLDCQKAAAAARAIRYDANDLIWETVMVLGPSWQPTRSPSAPLSNGELVLAVRDVA
jgi:hypothetical protein